MNSIKYDGISFNVDAVKKMGFKTFISHSMHENHWVELNADDKKEKLKSAFETITGQKAPVEQQPKEVQPQETKTGQD